MNQTKHLQSTQSPRKTQFLKLRPHDQAIKVEGIESLAIHLSDENESGFLVVWADANLEIEIERVFHKLQDSGRFGKSTSAIRFTAPSKYFSRSESVLKKLFEDVRGKPFETSMDLIVRHQGMKVAPSISKGVQPNLERKSRPTPVQKLVEPEPARDIKVLIIDDSKTVRQLMQKAIEGLEGMNVVGEIGDPREAMKAMESLKPDVITLDINMPHLSGPELLQLYIPKIWIPTVIVSALNIKESSSVLDALDAGAIDYIQKPEGGKLKLFQKQLGDKIKIASKQKVNPKLRESSATQAGRFNMNKPILIGSSTGGTEAIKNLFSTFPESIPPVLIVQHIPAGFSKAFADRLNSIYPFIVAEAQDGDFLKPNQVLIAPGDFHMRVVSEKAGLRVRLDQGDPVSGHRPSADCMFESAAPLIGKKSIGIILTGMGDDGAKGLAALKESGAFTIGQDEESCVVYGMPKAAALLGAVSKVSDLYEISNVIEKQG